MKKKQSNTIKEAIKEVKGMQESYYRCYFDKVTSALWQSRMDEIFSFYQGQIKACLVLCFKKNLTSKVTYSLGINSLRYLEMHIHSQAGMKTYFVRDIGIPMRAEKFMESRTDAPTHWNDWSATRLVEALDTLQLFFDHLNNENLHKQDGTTS